MNPWLFFFKFLFYASNFLIPSSVELPCSTKPDYFNCKPIAHLLNKVLEVDCWLVFLLRGRAWGQTEVLKVFVSVFLFLLF